MVPASRCFSCMSLHIMNTNPIGFELESSLQTQCCAVSMLIYECRHDAVAASTDSNG